MVDDYTTELLDIVEEALVDILPREYHKVFWERVSARLKERLEKYQAEKEAAKDATEN